MSQHFWTKEAAIIEAQHLADHRRWTHYVVRRYAEGPLSIESNDWTSPRMREIYPGAELIATIEPTNTAGSGDAGIHPADEEPVHSWFSLSYANYFVMPRSILEAMPTEWQHRWASLMGEVEEEFDFFTHDIDLAYTVYKRGENGRFVHDPLSEYRRPNVALIDSLRRIPKVADHV